MGHRETVNRQDIRVNEFHFHTARWSSSPLNLVLRCFYCEKDVGNKYTLRHYVTRPFCMRLFSVLNRFKSVLCKIHSTAF